MCAMLSMSSLLRVWVCNIRPMYMGTGVSWATLCLTDTVGPCACCVRLCLMLLNLSIWAMASAAVVVTSTIWSLMLGPSSTMLTRASKSFGRDSSWHLSGNPLKGFASPNICRRTICAAQARWSAPLSLSSSHALAREVPTSSSKDIKTFFPLLYVRISGNSSRSLSRVECTLVSSLIPNCSILEW